MNSKTEKKLKTILDALEQNFRKIKVEALQDKASRNESLVKFSKKRKTVILPCFVEFKERLEESDYSSEIENYEEIVYKCGNKKPALISFKLFPKDIEQSKFNETNTPHITFSTQFSPMAHISICDTTPEQRGTSPEDVGIEIDQINDKIVEDKMFTFLNLVLKPYED